MKTKKSPKVPNIGHSNSTPTHAAKRDYVKCHCRASREVLGRSEDGPDGADASRPPLVGTLPVEGRGLAKGIPGDIRGELTPPLT